MLCLASVIADMKRFTLIFSRWPWFSFEISLLPCVKAVLGGKQCVLPKTCVPALLSSCGSVAHVFASETIQIFYSDARDCIVNFTGKHHTASERVLSVLPGLFCIDFLIYLRIGETSFSQTWLELYSVSHSISRTKSFNPLRKGYFILSRNASADSHIQEAFRFSFVIICVLGNALAKSTFELCCAINLLKHFESTLKSTGSPI